MASPQEKVCVLGSGNWGSVAGKIVATNAAALPNVDDEVRMWVFEEDVTYDDAPTKLTEVINTHHVNVKYAPDVALPANLVADPSAASTVAGATLLVFCLPHQFLPRLLGSIKDHVGKDGSVRAISLIKGFDVDESKGIVLLSELITSALNVPCAVLMGANIANEVGAEQFSETTIGYHSEKTGKVWASLFATPYFRVTPVPDPVAVELCGALKNAVALGAGFVDGLGLGNNTKAAVIRMGLLEMFAFTKRFFNSAGAVDTYFESCGLADLITTCYGGRNRKCAEEFVKRHGDPSGNWDQIEQDLLNGQRLQGTLTLAEIIKAIDNEGPETRQYFPLFNAINAIAFEGAPPASLFDNLSLPSSSL